MTTFSGFGLFLAVSSGPMTYSTPHIVKPSDAPGATRRAPEAAGKHASHGARRSRGVALIEFAFVFPFLLILFFSIIDFGIYFLDQHTLQFATREGARVGLVGRRVTDAGGNLLSREESIVQTIKTYAAIALDPNKVSVSIYPMDASLTDPTGWKGTLDAGQPGSFMRVRSQFTYKFITPFVAQVMNNGFLVIQAEATYKNESF